MNRLYDVTVPAGDDIRKGIEGYVTGMGWESAAILGAVGSVQELVLTTPVENQLPLKTMATPCHGAAEILSFTGEVMIREQMDPSLQAVYQDKESPFFVHIHASCATAGGHVYGGGLAGGKAFRALRIFLMPVMEKCYDKIENKQEEDIS